jgi:hypothetical protein
MNRYDLTLINAQSAQDTVGNVGISEAAQMTEYGIDVVFNGTAAGGAVVIEAAHTPDFAGTWAVLSTVTFAAANKCHHVAITGVFRTLRARISSAITGGTVSVYLTGNG